MESILFEYHDLSPTPLELWNGKKKVSTRQGTHCTCIFKSCILFFQLADPAMRVGRCKSLHLEEAALSSNPPSTPSTPPRSSPPPAHLQLCSPGDIAVEAPFLRPRESYELGMQQGSGWKGESIWILLCTCLVLIHVDPFLPTTILSLSGKLEVFMREDGERGIRALVPFRAGQFVCEFAANLLTSNQYKPTLHNITDMSNFNTLQAHGYLFDPTMRPNAVGKYINHAAKGANLKLFPPIEARGKIRIGFVSITEIEVGEERRGTLLRLWFPVSTNCNQPVVHVHVHVRNVLLILQLLGVDWVEGLRG